MGCTNSSDAAVAHTTVEERPFEGRVTKRKKNNSTLPKAVAGERSSQATGAGCPISRALSAREVGPLTYDFNVWSQRKEVEKLKYIHRNPVPRGLVEKPDDWPWSSYRSYAYGEPGLVRINDWSWWRKRFGTRFAISPG